MTHTVHVAIPFRDQPEYTEGLLAQLVGYGGFDRIWLLDNGSTAATKARLRRYVHQHFRKDTHFIHLDTAGLNLTQQWNRAWDCVLEWCDGGDTADLAILNNDIVIPPDFLQNLSFHLRASECWGAMCPDGYNQDLSTKRPQHLQHAKPVTGVNAAIGWAFMVKVEMRLAGLPPIDPQFRYWGGEDDAFFAIEAHGKQVGLVDGLPCVHIGSRTIRERPDLLCQGAIDCIRTPICPCHDDLRRCLLKWGQPVPASLLRTP